MRTNEFRFFIKEIESKPVQENFLKLQLILRELVSDINALTTVTSTNTGSGTNVSIIANFVVTGETFVRGYGPSAIQVTLPTAVGRTAPVTVKHVGASDLTIVGVLAENIDNAANIILRGGRRNAVTLYPEGGNWWLT